MMRRRYPDAPMAAVSAVVIDADRVLLIQRAQEPYRGEWSLPGGAVELGETLEQAVCREVREETGLSVMPTGIVEVLDRIISDPDGRVIYHYILIDYVCRVTGGELRPASDAIQARWVTKDEVQLNGLEDRMVQVILKAFSGNAFSGLS